MNISKYILILFGLLPSTFGNSKNIWNYLGFLIVATEIIVALNFDIFYGFEGVRRAIEIVKFISPLVVHIVAIFELLLRQSYENYFKTETKKIPDWIILYVIISEIIKLFLDWDDIPQQIQNASCVISTIFIKIRFLYHIYYSSIIHEKLNYIKHIFNFSKTQDILLVKKIYNISFTMRFNLQEFYSFSVGAMLIHIFLNITADVYWIYVLCLNELYSNIINSIFFILDSLIVLYLPFKFCDLTLKTMRDITLIIGKLSSEQKIFSNLALQILNNPFQFKIFGFLQMNLSFMKEVSIFKYFNI